MLVSSTAGDPSADWDLVELDDDEDDSNRAEAAAGSESFLYGAENRIIGIRFFQLVAQWPNEA